VITNGPMVSLSKEQQVAVDRVVANHEADFILTGKAGAGKSTVIRALQAAAPVFVCATTGVAALNVGGCTVDTLFSIDRIKWEIRNPRTLSNNMAKVPRRIVIDECSMIGVEMARLIFDAARLHDKQLILVGDFAQAAPVKEAFALTSPLFMRAEVINLKECHRQSDGVFLEALNKIRIGVVDDSVRDVFRSRVTPLPADTGERTMRIYGTKQLAYALNMSQLAKISSRQVTVSAAYIDARPIPLQEKFPLLPAAVETALRNSPMANGDSFKAGARVMMTLNVYPAGEPDEFVKPRWVNGDLGSIVDILDNAGNSLVGVKQVLGQSAKVDRFMVLLDRTNEATEVGIVDMPIYGAAKDPVAYIAGFPMALGWGVTVHKSQSLTLPRAWVDMRSITFHPLDSRHGLAYVALSRVRTLEGLYLSGWHDEAVHCSPEMMRFIQP